jgi:hypothetical protein
MSNAIFAKFELGQTVATPGALELVEKGLADPVELLDRHARGDWGDVGEEDRTNNEWCLKNGERLMSVFKLGPEAGCKKLWVITERDRSITTILTPGEY